jgi:hypothetical protein
MQVCDQIHALASKPLGKEHPVPTGQEVVPRAILKVTGKRKHHAPTWNKNPVTLLTEAYVKYMS